MLNDPAERVINRSAAKFLLRNWADKNTGLSPAAADGSADLISNEETTIECSNFCVFAACVCWFFFLCSSYIEFGWAASAGTHSPPNVCFIGRMKRCESKNTEQQAYKSINFFESKRRPSPSLITYWYPVQCAFSAAAYQIEIHDLQLMRFIFSVFKQYRSIGACAILFGAACNWMYYQISLIGNYLCLSVFIIGSRTRPPRINCSTLACAQFLNGPISVCANGHTSRPNAYSFMMHFHHRADSQCSAVCVCVCDGQPTCITIMRLQRSGNSALFWPPGIMPCPFSRPTVLHLNSHWLIARWPFARCVVLLTACVRSPTGINNNNNNGFVCGTQRK